MRLKVKEGSLEEFESFYLLFKKTLEEGAFCYSPKSAQTIIEKVMDKRDLKERVKKGEQPFFLAYMGKNLAGYLLTRKGSGGIGFAHWLGVDSTFRGQGVGTALLDYWEKDEKKRGSHKVWLWTTKNNLGFYKKKGFTLGGEFPESFWGLDHFLFYKRLGKANEENYT